MGQNRWENSTEHASNLLFEYAAPTITPRDWKQTAEYNEAEYKKKRTPAVLEQWKNSITNINMIKTYLIEQNETGSKNMIGWIEQNITLIQFTLKQLKAIKTQTIPTEAKTDAELSLDSNLQHKITSAMMQYFHNPSERQLSLWKDCVNQLPIIEELILIQSIYKLEDQINYLEKHLKEVEDLKKKVERLEWTERKELNPSHPSYSTSFFETIFPCARVLKRFGFFQSTPELPIDMLLPNRLEPTC